MNTDFLHNRFDILESILHGILITDQRGHIIYWNRVCVDIFGYREEEIIGKSVRKLYYNDNTLPFKEVLARSVTAEINTGRWYARHKDGSPIWLDIRFKAVSDEERSQKFIVASVCNIEKKIIGKGREAQGLRKNGTVFPIDLAVSEVRWEGNRIFTGVIKDQTARRELERRMQEIGNEERRRIGRDLHDGLDQMLTGIQIMKYWAGIMGGVLEIVRKSENLTRVRCIVPQNRDYFN